MEQAFKLAGFLHTGRATVVRKARHKETGSAVVIKSYKDEKEASVELRNYNLLGSHRNICRLWQAIPYQGGMHLVLDYCGANLLDLTEENESGIPSLVSRKLGVQILHGLSYIHHRQLAYLALKPATVMLKGSKSGTPMVKLVNLKKIVNLSGNQVFTRKYDSPEALSHCCYDAPELLAGGAASPAADIWAFGCVIAELMTGKIMFMGSSPLEVLSVIFLTLGLPKPPLQLATLVSERRGIRGALQVLENAAGGQKGPSFISPLQRLHAGMDLDLLQLVWSCLSLDPSKRPTAQELLQHPCFDTVALGLDILDNSSQATYEDDFSDVMSMASFVPRDGPKGGYENRVSTSKNRAASSALKEPIAISPHGSLPSPLLSPNVARRRVTIMSEVSLPISMVRSTDLGTYDPEAILNQQEEEDLTASDQPIYYGDASRSSSIAPNLSVKRRPSLSNLASPIQPSRSLALQSQPSRSNLKSPIATRANIRNDVFTSDDSKHWTAPFGDARGGNDHYQYMDKNVRSRAASPTNKNRSRGPSRANSTVHSRGPSRANSIVHSRVVSRSNSIDRGLDSPCGSDKDCNSMLAPEIFTLSKKLQSLHDVRFAEESPDGLKPSLSMELVDPDLAPSPSLSLPLRMALAAKINGPSTETNKRANGSSIIDVDAENLNRSSILSWQMDQAVSVPPLQQNIVSAKLNDHAHGDRSSMSTHSSSGLKPSLSSGLSPRGSPGGNLRTSTGLYPLSPSSKYPQDYPLAYDTNTGHQGRSEPLKEDNNLCSKPSNVSPRRGSHEMLNRHGPQMPNLASYYTTTTTGGMYGVSAAGGDSSISAPLPVKLQAPVSRNTFVTSVYYPEQPMDPRPPSGFRPRASTGSHGLQDQGLGQGVSPLLGCRPIALGSRASTGTPELNYHASILDCIGTHESKGEEGHSLPLLNSRQLSKEISLENSRAHRQSVAQEWRSAFNYNTQTQGSFFQVSALSPEALGSPSPHGHGELQSPVAAAMHLASIFQWKDYESLDLKPNGESLKAEPGQQTRHHDKLPLGNSTAAGGVAIETSRPSKVAEWLAMGFAAGSKAEMQKRAH